TSYYVKILFKHLYKNTLKFGLDTKGYFAKFSVGAISFDLNVYGKVKEVNFANKADLWFGYNPMGNRIIKRVVDSLNNNEKLQVYALDAQGNTLAIYEIKVIDGQHELNCSERLIYGSSRLGMSKKI